MTARKSCDRGQSWNAPDFTARQLDLLAIRSSELADRVTADQIDFLDAVDLAYEAAVWSGLVDSVGDDQIQKLLAAAFANIGRG